MKNIRHILAATLVGMATCASAQTAVDAYALTPVQMRGTARFIGMGGAFTSLGGDLSSMTQNPGGLGLYRSSDIGLTFSIRPQSATLSAGSQSFTSDYTPVTFDNIGYVGVLNLGGTVSAFQWGLSYNRLTSFNRNTSGYMPLNTSLSNYIAAASQGYEADHLLDLPEEGIDPYINPDPGYAYPWLSILGYNSYMISPVGNDNDYVGLWQNASKGSAYFSQRERGYVDEYNIDLATNINEMLYVGLGVGIVDLSKTTETVYGENIEGANIVDYDKNAFADGSARTTLRNWQTTTGSGANFKFGFILRPTGMLRIGAAIHTPTYLQLNHSGYATADYSYVPDGSSKANARKIGTPEYEFSSKLTSPWRFMFGVSYVFANSFIVSADYERVMYNDMKLEERYDYDAGYDDWGYSYVNSSYAKNTVANKQVKELFQGANIVRLGLEYKALPWLSIRAGYNWQGSAVKSKAYNDGVAVVTYGTNPSYSFNGDTNSISLGLGFRYKAWYADIAYQYQKQTSQLRAFTPYADVLPPSASVERNYNNIVISTGIRF